MSYIPKQLVLLSKQSASNSASIAFTSVITATYPTYILKIRNMVVANDNNTFNLTYSTDNGATYLNSNYTWAYQVTYIGGIFGSGNGSASEILLADSVSNVSTEGINGFVTLYSLNTSRVATAQSSLILIREGGGVGQYLNSGSNSTTTPVNAIKIAMGSGNITSGDFYFYGVVEP